MLPSLRDHSFAVEAFFKSSIVLTFAVPKEPIENMIPPCLTLDTFDDKWAFIAAALVQTKDLRPKGFPKFMGNDFFLIGYRIFVRYHNANGKRLRGLYIIRSETDRKKMEVLGNIFTRYRYTTTDISLGTQDNIVKISSERSGIRVVIDVGSETPDLPPTSPFADWKQARRFAGPLPFTFTFDAATNKVLIIEGMRENWTPRPVKVLDYHFSFLDDLALPQLTLANAFIVKNINYHWKKGRTEQWSG